MAASNVSTDLVLLANAETYATDNSGVGGAWEIFGGAGGSSPGIGEDFAIEGTNAIDMKITSSNGRRGITFAPNTARALGTDEMFYVWTYVATNGILTQPAIPAGTTPVGLCLFSGNSTNNNYQHYRVTGSFREKGRSGECYGWVPDSVTSFPNGTEAYERVGTPASPWDNIGATAEFSANSKGSNFAVDSIRQGTGTYLTDGEVANPGTFDRFSSINGSVTPKPGCVVEPIENVFEILGVIAIGIASTGVSETATCVFTDSSGATIAFKEISGGANVNLRNKFIIGGSATTVTINSASFKQLGNSSGTLSAQVILKDSSLSKFTSCNFVNIGNWTLTSTNTNNFFTSCNFRSLKVTSSSATPGIVDASNGNFSFTRCLFTDSEISSNTMSAGDALLAAPLNKIQECTFETLSSTIGTGHAVNAGTVTTSQTYTWNSTAAVGTGNNEFAATDGSTGHEVIRINYTDTGAPLTIEYTGGATVPSVYNTGAGTVNVVAQQVNFELTSIKDATEIRIINASTNAEIAGVEDVTGGSGTTINNGSGTITVSGSTDLNTVNYAYTYSSDVAIKIAVINREEYEILYIQSTLTNANQSTQVFQREDRNFSDPV